MKPISLYDLKLAVHQFLGQLSVEELTENSSLITHAERLLRMFEVAQGY